MPTKKHPKTKTVPREQQLEGKYRAMREDPEAYFAAARKRAREAETARPVRRLLPQLAPSH